MKKLFTTLLLLISFSLQAQQHEIKLDAFGFLINEVNISYERILNNKVGIEIGTGYIFDPETLFSFNQTPSIPSGLRFKKRAWSFLAIAKYYKTLKPRGNKIILGTFLEYRTKPKIEEAYFEAYEEYFNEPDKYTPNASFLLGGLVGFKGFLFNKKILVEPMIGLGIDMRESEFDVGGFGYSMGGIIRLNLGYRFGIDNR